MQFLGSRSTRILAVFAILAIGLSAVAAPTVAGPPAQTSVTIIINEIMQNPVAVGDSAGVWFELYNTTTGDIDIEGWTISDNDTDSHLINNGDPLVIPAGGYLVLGNNANPGMNGGATVDYGYGDLWFLSSDADEVVLTASDSTEIDRVEYDGGPTFPNPTGASMALSNPAMDNNVGANWCTAGTPYGDGDLGTPGAANICAPPPPPAPSLPSANPGDVIINEIMQNPDAVFDSSGEWFELYNTTAGAIDIDGWTIKDNDIDSHVISNGGPLIIPAEGYLVLGNNTDSGTNGGVAVSYSYGGSWFLSNGADEVVLEASDATVIDRVEYDGGPGFPDPTGASMALSDTALDNNVGANWCTAGTPYGDGDLGTPGAVNICAPPPPPPPPPSGNPGDVIINEIMQNPAAVSDSSGEWFELYNTTTGDIDLDGWIVSDAGSDSFTINNGGPLLIPAGGYLVLGNNADILTNGGVTVNYQYSGMAIANGDDEVILTEPGTTEIDRVDYDGGPSFPDPNGASMALSDTALDNNVGANWCTASTSYGDGDLGTPGAANDCAPPPAPTIIINEVDADQVGTDSAEFVELYDGGVGNTDLTGLVLVLYNGSDDASYRAFDLDGQSTNASGYFVLCGNAANVANCDLDVSPNTNLIQNGADAVALHTGDASDFPNDTPLTTANLIDVIVYDTNDGDDAGLLVLLNTGQPQVNEGGGGNPTAHSNQRCPNGAGGPRNTDTYTQQAPSPGADNNCPPPPPPGGFCGDPATMIYEIQGSGSSSPLVGSVLVIEGVVVGDFQQGFELNGFFVQEEDADSDADPATSDGIFVFAPGAIDVLVGDVVRVQGAVSEFFDLTQLGSVSSLTKCETAGVASTALVTLPVSSLDDLERFEGMAVTIPQTLFISEFFNFDRFGEIVLSTDRQFQPTAVFEPGSPEAANLALANSLSRLTLDDGRSVQNPDPAIHPNGDIFDLDNLFRGGDQVANVTGVMHYSFGLYRIQPTQGADYTPLNARPSLPDDVGGTMTVASFNVLNYFTTIDTGADNCGPGMNLGCRGADNADEFTRQRDKIIAAIVAMDADIVGLMEIENHVTDEAVTDLVSGLNAIAGAGTYAAISTGPIGSDAIKVGLIYQPATVTPVGAFAVLDSTVDPTFIDTKNRPALAQTFSQNLNSEIFTVVVNHLKSKGSDCDDVGDPDIGDGQANCNLTRTSAAAAEAAWLATDPTGSGDPDFLVIGDLNAYDKEDPIDALIAGGYTDLLSHLLGEFAYTYVFDGQLGYLDHALANDALLGEVTGVTAWHINTDEADLIDYDTSFKKDAQDAIYAPDAYRSSDHDPVVVGMCLDTSAPEVNITMTPDSLWPPNHKYVDVTATVNVTDNDPNTTITFITVTSNEPDSGTGKGDKANDILILDDFNFQLRAERLGGGDGRVYTFYYQVTDSCGNSTIATATVTVPHDQGN